MTFTNPSAQLYANMKALTSKLKEQGSNKTVSNTKNDGIMLRRSSATETKSEVTENEQTMKIAKILMKLEEKRNGTA
jgi:hypothetical protein